MNRPAKKTLKVNIRGKYHKFWKVPLVRKALHKLDIEVKALRRTPEGELELELFGTFPVLWDAVKILSGNSLYFLVHDLVFEII